MPDRENVIKALECCLKESDHLYSNPCKDCPYEGKECIDRMKAEALALLKEQKAVVRCKDCRYGQFCTNGETTYQCFKWNSNEFGVLHEQEWFCADGEAKE